MAPRNVPANIARQLRQEAGFGCCICGAPIIQYHHIIEWSVEEHFRPEDMMVLCPLHHDQATKGAMPETEQRHHKTKPRNIDRGFAQGLLAIRQDYCTANFGTITVVGEGTFLRINGEDVFGLNRGEKNLEISLRLYSEQDQLLLEIDKNEWVSGDPLPWDIEADWQVLTLRERERHISISLNAKSVPLEVRAEMWRSGKRITLDSKGITIGPESGWAFRELALVGMVLEVNTEGLRLGPAPGNPEGNIISWGNRRERLWKAKDAWRIIKSKSSNRSSN
jgi:hypothetical protein